MVNKSILAITFLILNFYAFSGKGYSLVVKVYSLSNHLPLVGAQVSTVIKNAKVLAGVTNSEGEFIFNDLNKKSFDVIVEDQNGTHQNGTLYYYNPKRVDEKKEIHLRLTTSEEEKVFKAIDDKYKTDRNNTPINQILTGKTSDSANDTIDFEPTSPKGGIGEFYRFISMNLEYPQDCIEKNIQGKVYLSFIVQEDGTITNVVVEKGIHKSLDEEAVRIIRYAPKFNPALSYGKPIRALVRTPVNFSLN
jgi:TonB family protein